MKNCKLSTILRLSAWTCTSSLVNRASRRSSCQHFFFLLEQYKAPPLEFHRVLYLVAITVSLVGLIFAILSYSTINRHPRFSSVLKRFLLNYKHILLSISRSNQHERLVISTCLANAPTTQLEESLRKRRSQGASAMLFGTVGLGKTYLPYSLSSIYNIVFCRDVSYLSYLLLIKSFD